jgi:GTPase-associated protein 1, N-terminal domain type 2/GTPase-associated protein 1, C-terminal domain/GTPase-associated protein 1, middle domain
MTFWQLHYTSCERGLSGHSGFQFCAVTPNVPPKVLGEVERLTVYEPPRHMRAGGTGADTDDHPVNLIHTRSEFTGGVIIANVVFAGADFSQRSGNYFAHTLVSDTAVADGQPVLPIELWGSPFWEQRQGPTADLAALPALPPPGPVTREAVGRFLAAGTHRAIQLGNLLAAADEAIFGGEPVLVIDSDSAAIAHWIAAACYLLGPELGRALTFATYSQDPLRCQTHVVGALHTAKPFRPDITSSFLLLDMAAEEAPAVSSHGAAAMLARIGTSRAAPVWDLAANLGAPAGESLQACFPMLAAAALVLGQELSAAELDAALEQLKAPATRTTSGMAARAVRSALRSQWLDPPSASRQSKIVDLAILADSASAAEPVPASKALAGVVESALVDDTLTRLSRGEPLGEAGALRTDQARSQAMERCTERLRQVPPESALELIGWASAARVPLPDRDVREVGRSLVGPGLLAGEVPSKLAQAIKEWPALHAGLVDGVASLSASQQQALFAGSAGRLFRVADFASHPGAAEEWLVQAVANRRAAPAEAFEYVVKRRHERRQAPAADASLISRLWPNRDWTAMEASQIVEWLPPEELRGAPVQEQLGAILSTIPDPWNDTRSWRRIILQLSTLPRTVLQDPRLAIVSTLTPAVALLDLAASQPARADDSIGKLITDYGTAGPEVKKLLDLQLPPLLLWHSDLGTALTACPKVLRSHFANYAYRLLEAEHDAQAAARLYLATRVLGQAKFGEFANTLGRDVLAKALDKWTRAELDEVGRQVEALSPKEAATFKLWRSKRLGRRGRRALW